MENECDPCLVLESMGITEKVWKRFEEYSCPVPIHIYTYGDTFYVVVEPLSFVL